MFISVIDTTERVSSFLPSPKLRKKERKKKKRNAPSRFPLKLLARNGISIPVGCLENALYRVICESSHR